MTGSRLDRPPALVGALAHDDGERVRLHQTSSVDEAIEFEYELWSYGALVPAGYLGTMKSEAARVLLATGPLRLVSTTFANEALPQRLALTFRVGTQTVQYGASNTLIGQFDDEVARDFSALLSLLTRRRVFAIEMRRCAGLPTTVPTASYLRRPTQEPQSLKALDANVVQRAFRGLRALDQKPLTAFFSALRLYHAAVETLFSDPGLAYLHLVMALESIAGVVMKSVSAEDEEEVLQEQHGAWRELAEKLPEADRPALRALREESGAKLIVRHEEVGRHEWHALPIWVGLAVGDL